MPHRIMPFWGGWEIRTFELFREFQVGSNVFRSGMKPDEYPFYAYAPVVDGVAQFENARFYIDKDGNLKATNAEIEGKIVTGAGSEIDGVYIKDASITDAKIVSLSANKLTAGTIDASIIDVININAENIKTGTLTGIDIQGVNIIGSIITGGIFQTSTSGRRVVIDDTDNAIKFYDENGNYAGYLSGITGAIRSDKDIVSEQRLALGLGYALRWGGVNVMSVFSANTAELRIYKHLVPYVQPNLTLGTPSNRWHEIYGHNCFLTGNLDVDGNIIVDGTVDGVDISAFKGSFDTHKSTHYSSGGDL